MRNARLAMTADDFRAAGHRLVDRIAEHLHTRYLCLYAWDPRPRFDVAAVYEPVYEEPGIAIWRRRDVE